MFLICMHNAAKDGAKPYILSMDYMLIFPENSPNKEAGKRYLKSVLATCMPKKLRLPKYFQLGYRC